jgi:hypothetical protein
MIDSVRKVLQDCCSAKALRGPDLDAAVRERVKEIGLAARIHLMGFGAPILVEKLTEIYESLI